MDLYVLRHGLAEARNINKYPDDSERPLTGRGIRRLVRQVKGMISIELSPSLTITSPLVRAIQTAELVRGGLRRTGRLKVSEALAPWADPCEILEELAADHAAEDSVMVVGHEPHLSSLISLVVTGSRQPIIKIRKGALCKLRVPAPEADRCGQVEWSLTPRHMISLG